MDCIRLQKMSGLPLRPLKKGIIQPADALPVTSGMQRSQRKRKKNTQAPKSETPLLLDQMQTTPPYSMQQEPCSYPLRDKLRVTSQAACPAVLRRIMMRKEGKTCRCSNHWIPYVSHLEYDHLINNQMSFKEQIIVVCVSSSQTNKDPSEDKIEQLYKRNKNRSMPCAQEWMSLIAQNNDSLGHSVWEFEMIFNSLPCSSRRSGSNL
ncbi:uncharacterized protein LOC115605515 [Strigops habroptila]|uniref:uncharacterized protein LOC115605515 n=1 Tax=Strigops habroptila TaxID=2489341 RepID=UPI0011CEF417|nr:uncharacterized protein LOC115605515 [Strigops habroptila]